MASKQKLALVTGGSQGIGREIVLHLVNQDYKVAFTYNTNESAAQDLVKGIENKNIYCFSMDQGEVNSVKTVIDSVTTKLGPIDILVNNAAMSQEKDFLTISADDWDKMLAVNLRGPFLLTKYVLKEMINSGWGRIINISSIGGQWGGLNQVHYAASKAALINFTRSMAKLYSKNGVTTNCIAPGLIQTNMSDNELNSEEGKKKVAAIPIGRIGTTEELNSVIDFLLSDQSGYVTGQTINLNGGMLFST